MSRCFLTRYPRLCCPAIAAATQGPTLRLAIHGRHGTPLFSIVDGSVDVNEYNDLPVAFDANVNVSAVPYTPPTFGGGQSPTLGADGINTVITFLCTLTDRFDPEHPSAYALPAQRQAAIAAGSQLSSTD
jgi:hypothetical protein